MAGAEMLAARVAGVLEFLPLAAEQAADDVEHVHHLRVSCRRTAAVLRAFWPLIPHGAKKLDAWLKKIRRAAGPARDADVLIERFDGGHDLKNPLAEQIDLRLREIRCGAQKHLIKVNRQTSHGDLSKAAERCIGSLRRAAERRSAPPFDEYARSALAEAAQKLLAEQVDQDTSAEELHKLRIAAKRLRYSIELFHSAAAPEAASAAYPVVEEIQERLGAINDHAAAQSLYQKWLAKLPVDGLAALTAELVRDEWAAGQQKRTDFFAWWATERASAIGAVLAQRVDEVEVRAEPKPKPS